jgi:hypothetical protein
MKDEHPVKVKASADEPPEAGNMRANDARRLFVFRTRNQFGREQAVRHESVDEADNDHGRRKQK